MTEVDISDVELAGLSEAELLELGDLIDPDNELLPASERIPPHTRKKPTGPFDRNRLLQHLKTQAEESKIGEDYVPFVKKTPKEQPAPQASSKPSRAAKSSTSEFDDMLDMLDPEDLNDLAVELGLHGLVVQSQSRGDDDHPIGGDGASGRGSAGADVTYTSLPSSGSSASRRHYSTGSAGSSRSESPASTGSRSPHPDNSGSSSSRAGSTTEDPRVRLGSITEDKIRMFDSRAHTSESTDGGGSPVVKRSATRQMSSGCVEGGAKRDMGAGLKARRQLSAPGLGERGRSPSPFRLPGMSSNATQVEDVQETDIDEAIDSLQSDDPTLTELNLNNHTRLDAALISQLVEALHGNTHLTTLSLANIRFSEDHAKQFADVLRVNTSLTVVNLESNRITRKGIAAMMKALAENKETAVTELRMANQYFPGGAGAEADIAKYLEKITSIIRLGYNFTSPSLRTRIDRYIMRNTDLIRQKRASLAA